MARFRPCRIRSTAPSILSTFGRKGRRLYEAGGYDSSYNAVASALALRLLMLGAEAPRLTAKSRAAMRWQMSRISKSGEVSTQGNSRVIPVADGKSFLGTQKDVDVGHVVEALILADQQFSDARYSAAARRVVALYERRKR